MTSLSLSTVVMPSSTATTSVFTTMRWMNTGHVAWLPLHLSRMRAHAARLDIDWPTDISQLLKEASIQGEGNLCRIQLNADGTVELTLRESNYPNSPLVAISQAAPRFAENIQGTKHAAWEGYSNARTSSIDGGANIALLVHDGVVVDGDYCTPILLDIDGVALAPSLDGGGVDSITLNILKPAIEAAGIPFRFARLTENLLGRARELVVVGTGIGVAWLNEVDGQPVGTNSSGPLFEICHTAFESKLEDAWIALR